jgi:hypothetical protein
VGLAIYFLLSASAGDEPLPPIVMAWGGMCVGASALAALGGIGLLPMTATSISSATMSAGWCRYWACRSWPP